MGKHLDEWIQQAMATIDEQHDSVCADGEPAQTQTTERSRSTAKTGDGVLLGRYRHGEEEAAAELYQRYEARIRALAITQTPSSLNTRFDPDDVVQSVFRTLFRRVSKGMYDVPPGKELWSLLLVIALNKVRGLANYHRAQKRDASKTQTTLATAEAESTVNDLTSLKLLEWVVDDVLGVIPESHQEIVRLRIEGHEVSEIADATERSQRTVERVLQDFRIQLRSKIDDVPGR